MRSKLVQEINMFSEIAQEIDEWELKTSKAGWSHGLGQPIPRSVWMSVRLFISAFPVADPEIIPDHDQSVLVDIWPYDSGRRYMVEFKPDTNVWSIFFGADGNFGETPDVGKIIDIFRKYGL